MDRSGDDRDISDTAAAGVKGKGALTDGDKRLAVLIAVPLAFLVINLTAFTCYLVRRERKGDPLFSKLDNVGGGRNDPVTIEIAPVVRN